MHALAVARPDQYIRLARSSVLTWLEWEPKRDWANGDCLLGLRVIVEERVNGCLKRKLLLVSCFRPLLAGL